MKSRWLDGEVEVYLIAWSGNTEAIVEMAEDYQDSKQGDIVRVPVSRLRARKVA